MRRSTPRKLDWGESASRVVRPTRREARSSNDWVLLARVSRLRLHRRWIFATEPHARIGVSRPACPQALRIGGRGGAWGGRPSLESTSLCPERLHLTLRREHGPSTPGVGTTSLVDAETGAAVEVTMDARALEAYMARLTGLVEELRAFARRHAVTYLSVVSDEPLEGVVRRFVSRAVD